jgi:outer membrane receptor for monomeric catechols
VLQNYLIENLGEMDIKGFEISWKSRISDNLSTVAHYAYADQQTVPLTEPQSFEESVMMTAKHQFTLQLDWQFSEQLNLHLMHKYVGGIDDGKLPYLAARESFLDHYHSLDLVFGYQWTMDKTLTLSIRNLLQPEGQRWAPEFPTSRASNVDKRINLGIDIKF